MCIHLLRESIYINFSTHFNIFYLLKKSIYFLFFKLFTNISFTRSKHVHPAKNFVSYIHILLKLHFLIHMELMVTSPFAHYLVGIYSVRLLHQMFYSKMDVHHLMVSVSSQNFLIYSMHYLCNYHTNLKLAHHF